MKMLKTCLSVLAFTLAWNVSAADKLEPVDYVSPLVGTLSCYCASMGNEFLDATNRKNGRWLGLRLY